MYRTSLKQAALPPRGQATKGETRENIDALRSEVVFGTPSQNCAGSGVCFVSPYRPHSKLRDFSCPRAEARLLTGTDNYFSVCFRRADLSPSLIEKYFSEDFLWIDESFKIALTLSKRLGLRKNCVPAGRYPILETAAGWRIVFHIGHTT
jgi:hypothetical protein